MSTLTLRSIPFFLGLALGGLTACGGDKEVSETQPTDADADTDTDADSDTDADTDADTDTDTAVAVVLVSGGVHLAMGETMPLSAATVNAEDTAYTWISSDDTLASVDANGVVTGIYEGEVVISATGNTSGITGTIGMVVYTEVPHHAEWAASGHADRTAEAFVHWDEDGAVPASCARCHSKPGFLDYIGADGSAFGTVESDATLGSVIDCDTCHDPVANELDTVIFPSGVEVDALGGESRCMTCHQGRTHGAALDTSIEAAGLSETPDAVSSDLGFSNIHYYPAAATLYAAEAAGGYQYEGKVYDWKFRHVSERDNCVECHDPHSLEVRVDTCGECHTGVSTMDDLPGIRMMASLSSDYDGDGNRTEGIKHEISGLADRVLEKMQEYSAEQGLGSICYGETSYPYWFIDTDGNGECSSTEATGSNAWASWNPRLLRAAYNYQLATKDPGNFAHNAKYTLQLLHDSLEDVNSGLATPADLSAYDRDDPGHFNGAGEAARHWDEDETVSSSCSKCHGGSEGLHFYLEYGVGIHDLAPDNGLECETCHSSIPGFSLVEVDSITYPSGITIQDPGNPSNLCGTCHSGREAKASVDASIASGRYRFLNVHYLPAAATKAGSDAEVGYEYDGNTYAPAWTDHSGGSDCTDCHAADHTEHTFRAEDNLSYCSTCHRSATELGDIRNVHSDDVDGDGNASESLKDELDGLSAKLLVAMQSQAVLAGAAGICYNEARYPYWFLDADADGTCSSSETSSYSPWNANLMKAAFNYQLVHKDGGAWAHNFAYSAQLLIDSIEDLGGDTTGLNRPD